MNVEKFGKKVEDSGLKQSFIYNSLGISKTSWFNKKKGKYDFSTKEIVKLCELLGITSLRERQDIFFADL